MRFALRSIAYVILIGILGLLGFAVFSDLPAPVREISLPVEAR